jgi:hypothetical protein
MKVSLEYLYHFRCELCGHWWSQADIEPQTGDRYFCPHCGHCNTVEAIETFRNAARGSCLQKVADRAMPPQQ